MLHLQILHCPCEAWCRTLLGLVLHGLSSDTSKTLLAYPAGDFAAAIRAWRPPEPYKGKGIRFVGEIVRKKEGKRGK